VNNAELDAQHQTWIAIFNRLDHVMLNGKTSEITTETFSAMQAMREYTAYHFRQEEEYMSQINFPDVVAHKRLHTDFDDQLYQYQRKMRTGELILTSEIISIVRNWLVDHILIEDQKYASFSQSPIISDGTTVR
jgi:hemerythrin-like metal-binding protein